MEQQSKPDMTSTDAVDSLSMFMEVFFPQHRALTPDAFDRMIIEALPQIKEHRAIRKGGSKAFLYPNLVPIQPYYPQVLMVDDSDLYQSKSPAE